MALIPYEIPADNEYLERRVSTALLRKMTSPVRTLANDCPGRGRDNVGAARSLSISGPSIVVGASCAAAMRGTGANSIQSPALLHRLQSTSFAMVHHRPQNIDILHIAIGSSPGFRRSETDQYGSRR